jgi:hypothetical protein
MIADVANKTKVLSSDSENDENISKKIDTIWKMEISGNLRMSYRTKKSLSWRVETLIYIEVSS